MNSKRCIICNSTKWERLNTKKDLNLVKCRECHLVFRNTSLRETELKKSYTADYYKAWGLQDQKQYEEVRSVKIATFQKGLDKIERYTARRRILDIGCATGFFLEAAQQRGWQTYGVEISSYAAGVAREKFGNQIFIGTLTETNYPDNFFDAVTMFDLIEHLPDPVDTLKEVNRILKNSGVLMINTPNVEGVSRKLMDGYWIHFKHEHLYYFSPKNISRLLEKIGFRILRCLPAIKVLNLDYISSQLKVYQLPFLTSMISAFTRILPARLNEIGFSVLTGEMTILAKKRGSI